MTKSLYGDRDTVGTIAIDAMLNGEQGVCAGDMGHEIIKSLVDDLNITIESNPYGMNEFYITVHETKDLLMKNTIKRRMVTTLYRPFPEPNTSVWRTNPVYQKTWFCWSLPHWSLFDQCLINQDIYGQEQINDIKAFISEKNDHFGFFKEGKGWFPDPLFKDRDLEDYKPKQKKVDILF